jgi:hypothetical protein
MPSISPGQPGNKVSKEEVVLAFRLILGRLPENEKVIVGHQLGSLEELRIVLLRSAEFANKYQALQKWAAKKSDAA